ncbi:MAG TPA: PilN domain-containing protein [Burkholderiales bacterium]|nr:PilN domain-containing protein [Burkholderiales bacterium]
MMQQLQIDFSGTRRGSPWLGRLLLALAAGVALDAAWSYHAARSTLSENQARVAKRTPGGAAPKATPQEVAAVRETVQRLSLPWGELFSALESAASDKVALAGIEPDAKAGTVTITGDGKDYLAALSYVLNLSRTEGLERVQLVRHEQKNEGVSFAVSAAWGAK